MRGNKDYEPIGNDGDGDGDGEDLSLQASESTHFPESMTFEDADVEPMIQIGVLDVTGTTYHFSIGKEATVLELKVKLAALSNVEEERQRIIFRGRVLDNSELLSKAKVEFGSVLHLFQRPKTTELLVAARLVNSESESTRLSDSANTNDNTINNYTAELPSLSVRTYDFQASEIDQSRQGMRLLASCLFLISTMQLLEALANLSTDDSSYDDSSACNSSGSIYWFMTRSTIGLFVGILGYRASYGFDICTVRLYQIGVLLTAILSLGLRFNLFILVVTGGLDECPCPYDNSTSTASVNESIYSSTSLTMPGIGVERLSKCDNTEEDEHSSSALVVVVISQILLPSVVWTWCLIRARQYGEDIVRVARRDESVVMARGVPQRPVHNTNNAVLIV